MDIQATKLELIQRLLQVKKESVLEKLQEILFANEEEIVAYTTDGKPLMKEAYFAKVQQGIDDIEKGNYFSDEDFAREIETW